MKIIFITLISLLFSENNSLNQWNLERLYSNQIKNNSINLQNQHNNTILSNSIDVDSYIVGPGDKFFINYAVNDIAFSNYIVISKLNDIIIPNIGMINLKNLTLSQSYNKIRNQFIEKYSSSKIDITLTDTRKFYINIYGTNSGPSKILTNPLEKVSDVYEKIISKVNLSEDNNLTYRNIVLKRKSVSSSIDLLKYKRLGVGHNPYVLEGDKIYLTNYKKYIDIYGGVDNPGRYEFKNNEFLMDLINLCGGFTGEININDIRVSRFDNNQEFPYEISVNDDISNFLTFEYDHIIIPKNNSIKKMVYISGEVNIPGYYFLEKKMSVNDLINKAGGYTIKANKSKLMINNEVLSKMHDYEFNRINLIPPQNRSLSEISYIQSRSLIEKGSIISNDDYLTTKILSYNLNINDKVYVPVLINYIEIIGAVKNPGRYPFKEGLSISDYINEAGGKSDKYRGNIFIMNSFNQKIEVSKKFNEISNGDIIFIETKENFNTWNKLKESMSLIGQLATLIAVIQSASN